MISACFIAPLSSSVNFILSGLRGILKEKVKEKGTLSFSLYLFSLPPSNPSYSVSWLAVAQATSYRIDQAENGGVWRSVYAVSAVNGNSSAYAY